MRARQTTTTLQRQTTTTHQRHSQNHISLRHPCNAVTSDLQRKNFKKTKNEKIK